MLQRVRSDSVDRLSPPASDGSGGGAVEGPAEEERKQRIAAAAAAAAKRPPPSALATLGGALMAASIAVVLYRFASGVDEYFGGQAVPTSYTVRTGRCVALHSTLHLRCLKALFRFATGMDEYCGGGRRCPQATR